MHLSANSTDIYQYNNTDILLTYYKVEFFGNKKSILQL